MISLTFTNSEGTSIEMNNTFPYVLQKPEGIMGNGVITQIDRAFAQNGVNYYGSLDDARIINLTVYFNYATVVAGKEAQRDIMTIFNPRFGLGELVYEDDYVKYKIAAVVSLKPVVYNIEGVTMMSAFDVVFTCPDPDWLSYTATQTYLIGVTGGLVFPATFPITFGTVGGAGTISYDGDNPAKLIIDFRVQTAGVQMTRPRIVNELGEYIEIDKTVLEGEKILVDTNPNAPSITHIDLVGEETDIWEDLVYGSTFFQLHRGDNIFLFSSATGASEVYLTSNEHYA